VEADLSVIVEIYNANYTGRPTMVRSRSTPVELRHARQQTPAFEAELLEQFQARFVVPEDEADQRRDLERGRAGDRFF
jgi:hypothetical protein